MAVVELSLSFSAIFSGGDDNPFPALVCRLEHDGGIALESF